MNKFYLNNYYLTNVHKKMITKSEITTQMIYGDYFAIIKKYKKWLKVKINNDGYIGFIKNGLQWVRRMFRFSE